MTAHFPNARRRRSPTLLLSLVPVVGISIAALAVDRIEEETPGPIRPAVEDPGTSAAGVRALQGEISVTLDQGVACPSAARAW